MTEISAEGRTRGSSEERADRATGPAGARSTATARFDRRHLRSTRPLLARTHVRPAPPALDVSPSPFPGGEAAGAGDAAKPQDDHCAT